MGTLIECGGAMSSFDTVPDSLSVHSPIRHLLTTVTALIAVGMVLAPALGFVLLLVE